MTENEIIAAASKHQASCQRVSKWFAGVYFAPRLHAWDEQEVSFPTKAWINLLADTGAEAQKVAFRLFRMGCAKSSLHSDSPVARCVFMYVSNDETSDQL